MSILFEHKAKLEREEVSSDPRAERRRAQKSGRTLPNKSMIKVKLGERGKRQVETTNGESTANEEAITKRRVYWVRGHFMRNRVGGISWRNPHIRGARSSENDVELDASAQRRLPRSVKVLRPQSA